MIAIVLSTLATNIAANIVSPANDFSNLAPKKINFKTGGYITGIIGILIFPWKLIALPDNYIFSWLGGYSALLGPIGGIMIADYFFIKKQELETTELYTHQGRYYYNKGYNTAAIMALLAGILPNVPGFLLQIRAVNPGTFPLWISDLYHYAWFVGFFLSGFVYYLMMNQKSKVETRKSKMVSVVS
jgi:NCS1 family nucleobase:cation symporter-1